MMQRQGNSINPAEIYSTIQVSKSGITRLNGLYSLKSWSKPLIFIQDKDPNISIFRTQIPELEFESPDSVWVIAEQSTSNSNFMIHHYLNPFPSFFPPSSSWQCIGGIDPLPTIQRIQSSKNPKSKKKNRVDDSNDLRLPPTPPLPMAMVTVPWSEQPVRMKVLMFYHSKPHIFGCQFSNLFRCRIEVDSRYKVPTKDGTARTLLNYEEKEEEENGVNMMEFKSSENLFQAAKAKWKGDALFVHSLSPGDAARAGQGRLIMNRKMATKYRDQFGGNPVEIGNDQWQIRGEDKRYERREKWHEYKVQIMYYALRIKFETHYHLIREFVEGENPVFFVEHTRNDKQWGDNYDGAGTNYLGKLLTVIVWQYRHKMQFKDGADIDTLSDSFLDWLTTSNVQLIENGCDFYSKHAECSWLK